MRRFWHRRPRRRRVFGIETTVSRINRSVFFVPDYAAHRPVARKILNRRVVSPRLHRLVRKVMQERPGSMISAGTFFGDMLPSFSRKTPGLVYAFEPVVENYLLAREVVSANGLENVALMHAGLGAEPGPSLARVGTKKVGRRHRGGASRIISRSQEADFHSQLVPMMSIDQLALDDLSLIQLDVEGHELPVLQGAVATIQKQQPVIVVEDNRQSCPAFLRDLEYVEVARVGGDRVYLPKEASADAEQLIRATP